MVYLFSLMVKRAISWQTIHTGPSDQNSDQSDLDGGDNRL